MSHASPENDRFFPSSFGSSPFLSLVSHLNHVKKPRNQRLKGWKPPSLLPEVCELVQATAEGEGFFLGPGDVWESAEGTTRTLKNLHTLWLVNLHPLWLVFLPLTYPPAETRVQEGLIEGNQWFIKPLIRPSFWEGYVRPAKKHPKVPSLAASKIIVHTGETWGPGGAFTIRWVFYAIQVISHNWAMKKTLVV